MENTTKMKDYAQSAIEQGEGQLKSALRDAEEKLRVGREQVAKAMAQIDKHAHDNPWPIIAGTAVGCLLLGIVIGKSRD